MRLSSREWRKRKRHSYLEKRVTVAVSSAQVVVLIAIYSLTESMGRVEWIAFCVVCSVVLTGWTLSLCEYVKNKCKSRLPRFFQMTQHENSKYKDHQARMRNE